MNITKEVITDLFPLYAANECSSDTRQLVQEYLQQHPREAEELQRIMETTFSARRPSPQNLDEMESLRRAKRRVRRQSWLMALAIFFSLAPFSFLYTNGRMHWLWREAPTSALVYGVLGIACWITYAVMRRRFRTL